MAFTPKTPAGTVATLVDRLADNLEDVFALVAVQPAGQGISVTANPRAAALEVLGRTLQDMIAAETNNTIKNKLTAVATQLGVL